MNKEKALKVIAGSPDKLLKIGSSEMEVYVLQNGQRVIHTRGLQRALGLGDSSGSILTGFLDKNNIKPFISEEIYLVLNNPVKFKKPLLGDLNRTAEANGFEATILQKICSGIIRARRENLKGLTQKDLEIAQHAEILQDGFATIGIIALVDNTTGYNARVNEYQDILKRYIADELKDWVKTFPDSFFEKIYRVMGWDWNHYTIDGKNHPQYVGFLINKWVYEKLPAGSLILKELKRLTPKNEKGNVAHKYHQKLTDEARSKLSNQIGKVEVYLDIAIERNLTPSQTDTYINEKMPTENLPSPGSLFPDYYLPKADKAKFYNAILQSAPPASEE